VRARACSREKNTRNFDDTFAEISEPANLITMAVTMFRGGITITREVTVPARNPSSRCGQYYFQTRSPLPRLSSLCARYGGPARAALLLLLLLFLLLFSSPRISRPATAGIIRAAVVLRLTAKQDGVFLRVVFFFSFLPSNTSWRFGNEARLPFN